MKSNQEISVAAPVEYPDSMLGPVAVRHAFIDRNDVAGIDAAGLVVFSDDVDYPFSDRDEIGVGHWHRAAIRQAEAKRSGVLRQTFADDRSIQMAPLIISHGGLATAERNFA